MCKSGKYHKIGHSNAPGRRGYELGLSLPEGIKPVHEVLTDDPAGVEKYWHNRFSEKRVRGEFFNLPIEDYMPYLHSRKIDKYSPTSGFGLGWERILHGLLEMPFIWSASQFPRIDSTLKL